MLPLRIYLLLSLSYSLSGMRGDGGSSPQSVPGSPRGVVDQLRLDACDEFPEIGSQGVAALCWADEVVHEQQVTIPLPVVAGCSVDIRPRCFHHEKVAAQEALIAWLVYWQGHISMPYLMPKLYLFVLWDAVPFIWSGCYSCSLLSWTLLMIVVATLPLEKPLKCIDHAPAETGQLSSRQSFVLLTHCVKGFVQRKCYWWRLLVGCSELETLGQPTVKISWS